MSPTPLFEEYFPENYDEDDFGHSKKWNGEIEKWLKHARDIDADIYYKQQGRVSRAKQRDELLGEFKAMYAVGDLWDANKIYFTDEENATIKTADFTFEDHANQKWFAEVKSTSWEAELAEDYERGEITLEQFKERKKKPQFINGEGRWMSFEIFRNPIIDALEKFKVGRNNMLFLCPNTFGPLELFGEMEEWHKLRSLISELDIDRKISSICFLNVGLYSNKFKYTDLIVKISRSPKFN